MVYRVVAKKIISRLRFSLNRSPFFAIFLEQISSPIFRDILLHVNNMAEAVHGTWREHAKHVPKTRFYSNYLTRHSGTDTQGSHESISNCSFTCRLFDMVQISNECV